MQKKGQEQKTETALQALPLEERLNYWKGYITLHHVLACELSYSLIYDNIRPDRLQAALSTVGLEQLPNRFLLIQVDDYQNTSSGMRITQEFFQKTVLINLMRDCLARRNLQGFVANVVGADKLICFLCCEGWEDEAIYERLLQVAEELKALVRDRSVYTISVCISERCERLGQFSQMYPKMELALNKSYFTGKECSILLRDVKSSEQKAADVDLKRFYPELLASVIRNKRERFERLLQDMIRAAVDGRLRQQQVRISFVHLMQRITDYCLRCGVPETQLLRISDRAMNEVVACSFLSDVKLCMLQYYEQVTALLRAYSADTRYSFSVPVGEYIAMHYQEPISLRQLSDMMGFSEGHFARTFRKKFGVSFVQYLSEYRIRKSRRLLTETHLPIEQIAYRVGINSYSYFCTCFKHVQGMTPGQYRAEQEAQRQETKVLGTSASEPLCLEVEAQNKSKF